MNAGSTPAARRGLLSAWLAPLVVLLTVAAPLEAHLAIDLQIEELNARISREPGNSALYLKRGEQHRVRGAWDLALADFDRAAAIDPGLTVAYFHRGRTLLDAGRPALALAPLDRLLERMPDHIEGRVVRARVLVALGRPLEAAREFDRAISLHRSETPPRPEHYLERARAYAAAGRDFLGRAVRGLDEGISRLGPVPSLTLEAIELEVRRGRFDAALARVDRAMAGAARRESWLVRRGEILEAAGRKAEARRAFLEARAAIGTLPPGRRATPAVRQLEARIDLRLRSAPVLETAGSSAGPKP